MSSYIIDIDDELRGPPIIANDFSTCPPKYATVERVNHLYEQGNKITLFLAKVPKSNKLVNMYTKPELQTWLHQIGIKYHNLILGEVDRELS